MPAFAEIDHAARVAALDGRLASGELGCDALLISDLTDIRWLTGFTGSNGLVVMRPGSLTFGTDTRYGERATAETAGSGAIVIAIQDRTQLREAMLGTLVGAAAVGVDPSTTTHAAWERLAGSIPLTPIASPVAIARRRKDAAEIERIEAAARSTDAALADVEPMLLATTDTPVTEADVRDELEYRMRRHGADDRSYETIVASGPEHAARPHHEVGRRTIVEGDTVVIDVGALVDGYHSDMTRSYVIGAATDEQHEVYDLVQRAQTAGLVALHAGVAAAAVDAAARDVFVEAGYGDWYLHGTGHGVGLEIHESPFHAATSDETIEEGNVVTIEPGLYRSGFGGIRIEDLAVVTADGHRVLTNHPKRPLA
ncbi:MAG: aminopeptidase P family protein [Ilumatobacter sp.]|nr:aminopeptidase P family protein [Ilumatobacter sp.]